MSSTPWKILAIALVTAVAEISVLQNLNSAMVFGILLAGNSFIAAAAVVQTRRHPSAGPTTHPADPRTHWSDLIHQETSDLAPLADHVFVMAECEGTEDDFSDSAFVRLDDLRWLLGQYVLTGGRLRRLLSVPDLIPTFGVSGDLRSAADKLVASIRQTNVVVVEWLLAHRVALPDPDILDSNALFDRYRRVEIEPASVSSDPLYLLTCHIHDVLETAESMGDLGHSAIDTLEVALGRPLAALEQELAAAAAFDAALVALGRSARESRSSEAA